VKKIKMDDKIKEREARNGKMHALKVGNDIKS